MYRQPDRSTGAEGFEQRVSDFERFILLSREVFRPPQHPRCCIVSSAFLVICSFTSRLDQCMFIGHSKLRDGKNRDWQRSGPDHNTAGAMYPNKAHINLWLYSSAHDEWSRLTANSVNYDAGNHTFIVLLVNCSGGNLRSASHSGQLCTEGTRPCQHFAVMGSHIHSVPYLKQLTFRSRGGPLPGVYAQYRSVRCSNVPDDPLSLIELYLDDGFWSSDRDK